MPERQGQVCLCAKGAEYDSQGQARSEAKRAAPGSVQGPRALKGRNRHLRSVDSYFAPSQGSGLIYLSHPGAALLRRLPLAVIFRAFGARV